MSGRVFDALLENLRVSNRENISTTYKRITARLNRDFHGTDSETSHSLQVGSFGRRTAIDGVSDLDMLFEFSQADFARINGRGGNGQSAFLQEVRDSLLESFPRSPIRGDGPVVVVPLAHHDFEVLPAFQQEDGSYLYGDTKSGGSWRSTNPRAERNEFDRFDAQCNGNMRQVAKILRAWKNTCGAPLGGWLIDTLAYRFIEANPRYAMATLDVYGALVVDLFWYLAKLPEGVEMVCPGSNEPVPEKGNFRPRAARAARKCDEAAASSSLLEKCKKWRSVFGRKLQMMEEKYNNVFTNVGERRSRHEQYVEELFPVDIRYGIRVDYEVTEDNRILWDLARLPRRLRRLPTGRGLRFFISECDVPEPFEIRWKVKNRGPRSAGQERGEIFRDEGRREKIEHTRFEGEHYVEAYAIKDGVCVGRDRAPVPITV